MTRHILLAAGHVTAGGSICIEALTMSGTAGSWTSQYNVESILNIVILNMIGVPCHCCLGLHAATVCMQCYVLQDKFKEAAVSCAGVHANLSVQQNCTLIRMACCQRPLMNHPHRNLADAQISVAET